MVTIIPRGVNSNREAPVVYEISAFKFHDSDANTAFAEFAQAEGLHMAGFTELLMHGIAQRSGAAAVDNGYLL